MSAGVSTAEALVATASVGCRSMTAPFRPPRRLVARTLVALTPLRWRRVRVPLVVGIHRLQRRERLKLEARGDRRLSTPALDGMDVRLAELLGRDGYFVEAGAYDGYTQSNTYYLERFCGWRGLLVEPVPMMYREAVLERPRSRVVNCALVPPEAAGRSARLFFGGKMTVTAGARGSDADDRAWAGTTLILGERDAYEFEVRATTLSGVLDEVSAPEVDLMSLDMEGYEAEALRGLDLRRHAPRHLLVEAHDGEHLAQIKQQLGDRYVELERLTASDVLFRRADLALT
jgi:FkbM family methyltransferase